MKITFWSDYACPYCYIGEVRLRQAIKELGLQDEIEFDARAYELDPNAPVAVMTNAVDRYATKYGVTREQALAKIDTISRMGQDAGIDFKYASAQYTNTLDAHRLYKLAVSKGDPAVADKVNGGLFAAYFTDNLPLADESTLLKVAEDAGLNRDEVREMLASNRFVDDVRADEQEAAYKGVRGVPYFMFAGEFDVPGALSVEDFKHAIMRAMKLQSASDEQAAEAHQCGPDGCRL